MTWNIEGLKRNKSNLVHFIKSFSPDLIFLSEANMFQCDLELNMKHFQGEYKSALNSNDLYDLDLPLNKTSSYGGTMFSGSLILTLSSLQYRLAPQLFFQSSSLHQTTLSLFT